MAHSIETIRKHSTFIMIRKQGKLSHAKTFSVQLLEGQSLNNSIHVGFTASKKLGTAIKRNKAKRIMRELTRKVIAKYGKINSYYVLIAKTPIFEIPFHSQELELKKLIS